MGFFSDLKEDLSQAVNELMPEDGQSKPEETAAEPEVSLEEMLKNIDEIQLQEETEPESREPEAPAEPEMPEPAMPETVVPEVPEEATETMMPEPIDMPEEAAADGDLYTMSAQAPEENPGAEPEMPETQEDAIQNETETEESKGEEEEMDMEMEMDREVSDETSIITEGMTVTGDISTRGSIDVIGTVNGNIDAMGKLNITGHVNGNSKASEIYAESAKINGEVISEGAVKIGASSVIIGNITATSAAIAGAVKGDIDVKGPVILDASAIVMGNIKSKSVQINNGAVIEGMCSQCYADVSPTSFFEEYKPEGIRKAKAAK